MEDFSGDIHEIDNFVDIIHGIAKSGLFSIDQGVGTRSDSCLSRMFANKDINIYPVFAEFYGMEEVIEQFVSYFRHAIQGLEEKKQILYLLDPVDGGMLSFNMD